MGWALAALFSGLRPPKQLERSKLFIYHDDYGSVKVREREKARSPAGGETLGCHSTEPGVLAADGGGICCQTQPS